jgi:CheY-like chemotaxis protein
MSRREARRDMPRNTARHPVLTAADASGRVPRVLIVDDHEDTRALYAEYLSHKGMEVAEAADGIEALIVAARFAPDVALVDLSMPRADGISAISGLRAMSQLRGALIYLITAFDSDLRLVRVVGIDRLIIKPCAPHDLYEAIRGDLETTGALQTPRGEETG